MTSDSSMIRRLWSHPIVVVTAVLVAASGIALAVGMPIHRVTQIAIYTLYGAGVNFLIGYIGLVPFRATIFIGCASHDLCIASGAFSGSNELTGIAIATLFSLLLALVVGAVILRRRGLYFSLLTLACSQIAFEIAFKWTAVTVDQVYIADTVAGVLLALDKPQHRFDAYNIATGTAPTLRDTADAVNRAIPGAKITVGDTGPYHHGGRVLTAAKGALDIRRAAAELGYRPRYDLQQGIEATIEATRAAFAAASS